MAAGEGDVVLATKLFAPRARPGLVARNRLLDLLRSGLEVPLTILESPAGWGKSTAVADWLRRDRVQAGWVSLDDQDNDPKRFWRYLLLAAGRDSQDVGAPALRRLDAAGSDVRRDVVPSFVGSLVAAAQPTVLVLDDYHLITSEHVHASLRMLLERCPPGLHLVVLTRTEPPLRVGRMRVARDVVEIGPGDLRFTTSEAAELLNDGSAPRLERDDVDRLVSRTEGWAAGLQLAALRLRSTADPAAFVQRFSGADSHVVDYLGHEVLEDQPPRVREFLLKTSVVERLCAPLCDALTEGRDSLRLLERIQRENLFVIPLDDQRHWVRYHHLFRDLLRQELTRTSAADEPVLHGRAARWHAAHGDAVAAVTHAFAAGDLALAARLVASQWRTQFNAGHWVTVQSWLQALPAEMIADQVPLTVARVWIATDSGRLDEVAQALDAAAASGHTDPELHVLRALHTWKTGDVARAAALLRTVPPTEDDRFVLTVHRLLIGVTALWAGDLGVAHLQLIEAARSAKEDGNLLGLIYARGYLALLGVQRGDPDTAALVDEAERLVQDTLSEEHFVAMIPALARARLGLTKHEHGTATSAAMTAVELARRGAGRVELAAALLSAARATSTGDAEPRSASLIAEARALLRDCADPGALVESWLSREDRARRAPPEEATAPLTERELDILRLLPTQLSQRELARTLFVTPNTVKTHVRAIYRKLGADSRRDAVLRARTQGLL